MTQTAAPLARFPRRLRPAPERFAAAAAPYNPSLLLALAAERVGKAPGPGARGRRRRRR